MRTTVFTAEYFEVLNELLKDASPMGAYAMGGVTVLACDAELDPDRQLLYAASRVVTLHAIDVVFEAWKRGKQPANVREAMNIRRTAARR